MRVSAAALCLVVWVLITACQNSDDAADDRDITPAAEGTSSVQEIAEEAASAEADAQQMECADVAPIVGYLPWLAPGEPILAPKESSGPNGNSFFRSWHAPGGLGDEDSQPIYVLITVDTSDFTNTGGGPGRPIGVVIGGDEGEFHVSPTPNSGYIAWDTDDETCDLIGLTIEGPESWTQADTEREIIRVAESLR